MSEPPAQPPEQSSAGPAGKAADSELLMDQFLPRYDFAVVHADVLRAPPAQCYGAAGELDLFQARWFGPCSASGDCHSVWWAP